MFSHQGPDRSPRQNRLLAAYLALNAGFVNCAGFVLLGSFTSHVTGSVGHMADELSHGAVVAALADSALVVAFALGAFVASALLQSSAFRERPTAYGFALLLEALVLGTFMALPLIPTRSEVRTVLASKLLLSMAMGMQNSMVTVISGARVRTTHLTGVTTDLAIELAAWARWMRKRHGDIALIKPEVTTAALLATVVFMFVLGSCLGAASAARWHRAALLLPTSLTVLASGYAYDSIRRDGAAKNVRTPEP